MSKTTSPSGFSSVPWEFTDDEIASTRALCGRLETSRRLRAQADAMEIEALAEAARIARAQRERAGGPSSYDFPFRSMASETAGVLHESKSRMMTKLADAEVLVERYPATVQALAEGRITVRHVDVIRRAGERLPEELDQEYEEAAIGFAETASPGQLRAFAIELAERLCPTPIADRHAAARARRRVRVDDLEDGVSRFELITSTAEVHAARDRIRSMARAIVAENRRARKAAEAEGGPEAAAEVDPRTQSQIEADLWMDLALTGRPSAHALREGGALDAIQANVQIVIPVETLVGLDDEAAFVAGHGPVDPETARRLAGHAAGWDRVFLRPDTGALLTVDRYAPTAAQRRFLLARDETCRGPGCENRAATADLDHTIPYLRGGETCVGNLECLCEGCHLDKHHSPWTVRQISPGVLEWVSPIGRTSVDRPRPQVRFESLPEPRARSGAAPPGEWPSLEHEVEVEIDADLEVDVPIPDVLPDAPPFDEAWQQLLYDEWVAEIEADEFDLLVSESSGAVGSAIHPSV
ncbi:DUF222 domain-containing protein [Microbacterium sp. KNMS]